MTLDDHIRVWLGAEHPDRMRAVDGFPSMLLAVWEGRRRCLLEKKANCDDPWTLTHATKRKEVTIDWAVWEALRVLTVPTGLVIAHDRGLWIWTQADGDARQYLPGRRRGGRGGTSDLSWWPWSGFAPWRPPGSDEAEPRGGDVFDLFGGDP